MPPQRRKAAEPADAPEVKKRVTRSASKQTVPSGEAPKPLPAKAAPVKATPATPASKVQKRARPNPPKAQANTGEPKQGRTSLSSPVAGAPTTLAIQHASLKSSVTCHQYTPPAGRKPGMPPLVFTHGTGGTLSTPAVVNFCAGYASSSPVLAFRGSMNLAARVKGFHACLAHLGLAGGAPGGSLILGGRSMGARAAVMAASELLASLPSAQPPALSLILVSYPLQGPKGDVRDGILMALPPVVRVLFVVGDRDAMCPLELLAAARGKMAAPSQLVVVRGADHGMHVRPADTERRLGEETGKMAAAWVEGGMGERDVVVGEEE